MFDIDHFKHFNDYYGHLAGDDCLRSLAQVLLQDVRCSGELVARYGGEEFVVLLSDSNLETALETAQRIQRAVRSLALVHAGMPHGIVSFSFGVASLNPSRQHGPAELIRQADLALYRAKASGRDCIECSTE